MINRFRRGLLFCFAALFCAGFVSNVQAQDPCRLSVGVVPQFEQRKLFDVWTKILEPLEKKTGCHFDLVGSPSIIAFEDAFKSGTYDLAYMNPYHVLMAKQAQGYRPLVRSGTKKLTGILVVKKDSPINNVKELDGKKVAFPSPNAFGASLLMRAELARQQDTHVVPEYVKTHPAVYLYVAKGLVDAGGGIASTLAQQPDNVRDSLRILYKTEVVNPHPLVIHPRVPEAMATRIQAAWLELAKEQPSLFEGIPMEAPVPASYEDYQALEKLTLEDFIGTDD